MARARTKNKPLNEYVIYSQYDRVTLLDRLIWCYPILATGLSIAANNWRANPKQKNKPINNMKD